MELLDQWFKTFESVLTGPTEFFQSEERRDGFGYPLKFAAVSLVFAALLQSLNLAFNGFTIGALPVSEPLVAAAVNLVASPVVGFVILGISAALVHVFASLLGAEHGYSETLAAVEYGTAISPLSALTSFVPVVGGLVSFVLFLYVIHVDARALENFQGMSYGRAGLSLGLPILLALIVSAFMVVWSVTSSPI